MEELAHDIPWHTITKLLEDLHHLPIHTCEHNFLYLLEGLAELVHASSAFAVFARRTLPQQTQHILRGWRPIHLTYLNPDETDHDRRKRLEQTMGDTQDEVHHGISAHVPFIGSNRALLWSDILPGQTFEQNTFFKELYEPINIHDRMFGILSVDTQLEVFFCIDRPKAQPPFTRTDTHTVAHFLRAAWPTTLRYCQLFGFLDNQETLTTRERETLSLLLQGLSEKEVATKLGVTPRSAHQYVTTIYRKLGVNSRAQLMARWLELPTFQDAPS